MRNTNTKNTILITGASRGIGKATAKFFQLNNWNVIATMRSPEKEEELNKLESVLVVKLDVQDNESIKKAIELGIEKFGKIDVILNNAGYGALGLLEATPVEYITKQFDVNVVGPLRVTKAILPHFRKNKNGTLINLSSGGGKTANPLAVLYNGTKFAMEGFSEALVYEMSMINCRVKIIEPGAIKTSFEKNTVFSNNESMLEYQPLVKNFLAAYSAIFVNATPPEEVAKVIYKAATDKSDQLRYVVGKDAQEHIKARESLSDEKFIAATKQKLGITTSEIKKTGANPFAIFSVNTDEGTTASETKNQSMTFTTK